MDFDDFLEDDSATLADIDGPDNDSTSQINNTNPSLGSDLSGLGEEDAHHALIQTAIKTYGQFEAASLTVAMAELLDEMSNGRLSKMHIKTNAERMIIISAGNCYLIESMRLILKSLQNASYEIGPFYEIFIESNKDFNSFIKEKYVKIYSDICDDLGLEKDTELCESGYYADNTPFRKYGLANPPHKNDNNSTL